MAQFTITDTGLSIIQQQLARRLPKTMTANVVLSDPINNIYTLTIDNLTAPQITFVQNVIDNIHGSYNPSDYTMIANRMRQYIFDGASWSGCTDIQRQDILRYWIKHVLSQ